MGKDTVTSNTPPTLKYVGLDVHKDTIAVAVAEDGKSDTVVLGTYPNEEKRLRAVLSKIGRPEQLRVCYEAGPCGYVIYRFLEQLKIHCDVVAPSLIPRKPGDRCAGASGFVAHHRLSGGHLRPRAEQTRGGADDRGRRQARRVPVRDARQPWNAAAPTVLSVGTRGSRESFQIGETSF
jgi:hypothetical protein